ncbi:MAG: Sensor protein SrrB [Planctomycetes bacterium ADurb.Bin126]|nr:MAG: Sensor protein SrrB [Planctomycetes bacterium ADurb.Bin126]HOD82730.1 HAMP domain-containing sensor histidine kinase [Phycisphaerae bacterium]HQL73475.1 HAMP domain-containing sensor histidine kinase [Phycisphaerae bacterium]
MKSTLRIWLIFSLALAVVLGVMAWVSWTVLRLDEARTTAACQAELEEAARLALWRMDAAVPALLFQEHIQPLTRPGRSGLSVTSHRPTDTGDSPVVVIRRFTLDPQAYKPPAAPAGPEAPTPDSRPSVEQQFTSLLRPDALLTQLPDAQLAPAPLELAGLTSTGNEAFGGQSMRNMGEMRARAAVAANTLNQMQQQMTPRIEADDVHLGPLQPLWMGGELLVARKVKAAGRLYVQGCWMDWPGLRSSLLTSVKDLLPNARLEPATGGAAERGDRLLAGLPVRLIPGEVRYSTQATSPIRTSLLIAWVCLLVAAGAVAALLGGALALGRRRGDFVSSVTHELRTPLTTFRMYSEMLRDGIVADDRRQDYLDTLHAESNRLTHLVENVLTYSRLESRPADLAAASVPLGGLLDGCVQRLRDHCAQAGMELDVRMDDKAAATTVRADPWATELVLFNLVDNACKYAASADDKRIHLEAEVRDGWARLRVRDHGPGIARRDRRKLFRAFARLRQEMAGGKQGVGLGLTICRRLARSMGGTLAVEDAHEYGACFCLLLRSS